MHFARRTLAWRRRLTSSDPLIREDARVAVLERLAAHLAPEYVLPDTTKTWPRDEGFMANYRRLMPGNDRSAERKFAVWSLAISTADLPGDTAEAGVYTGATSWLICDALAAAGKTHHAFDSFEGLPRPLPVDGGYWRAGDLSTGEDAVRELLAPFPARVHRGWIPRVFAGAALGELCFAHVDVDLYEPTRASLEYLYPLLVSGGMLVCDDYGFRTCPGARRAVDEFMAGRPETVIHLPTGQALIIKRDGKKAM